jgi:DNA-binding LytR/AlgR family response regulator
MPGGMTGPDLAARARERTPGLKVLFATGYGGGAPAQNGSLPDGAKIVAKPYEEAELARKIRESLGAQR